MAAVEDVEVAGIDFESDVESYLAVEGVDVYMIDFETSESDLEDNLAPGLEADRYVRNMPEKSWSAAVS